MKQHVPRGTTSNAMVQAAYDTYFASMKEGMIVLAHSQGGLFALEAARKHGENIRGVIMLESSSDLDVDKVEVSCFRDIPFLFLYGDFLGEQYCIDGYKWPGAFAWEGSMRKLHHRLQEMGGDSTWTELPDLGIRGNTHALMMEDNSDEIADLICDWIKSHIQA